MARRARRLTLRGPLFALVAIYLTFFGVPQTTARGSAVVAVHHAIITLLLLGWLAWLIRRGDGFPRSPLDGPFLALFVAYAIGTLFAVDPRVSAEGLWLLGWHILLFYIALSLMRAYGVRAVLEPLMLAAGVVVLIGLVEFASWYFGWPLLPDFRQGWPAVGGLRDPLPPVLYRLRYTLSIPTTLSAYLGLLIPTALAWGLASRHRDTRQGMLLWVVGAFVVEGLAFSRGGLLALAVSLPTFGVLVMLGSERTQRMVTRLLRDWRVLLGIALLVGLAAVVGYGWLTQDYSGHRSGDLQRWDMWRSAVGMVQDFPLTGVGAQGFGRVLRLYRDPITTNDHMNSPHNVPLMVASEAGLLGLAAFGWLLFAAIRLGVRRWRTAEGAERVRISGMLAALLGFAAQNMFDNFSTTVILLIALTLVAYLALPEPDPAPAGRVRQRVVPAALLALVLLGGVGWALADSAAFAYTRALRQADAGDLGGALDSLAQARRLDPAFGLYAAQVAQFTGERAVRGDVPLGDALAAYESAFAYEPTSDEMRASYAMLLAEAGDAEAAAREMAVAAGIQPRNAVYRLWAGALAEAAGDETAAVEWYEKGLDRSPDSLTSDFWEDTALRQQVRRDALAALGVGGVPLDDLAAVPSSCWDYLAEPPPDSQSAGGWACRAEVALRVDDDPAAAVAALDEAIRLDATRPGPYLTRAEAHRMLGDLPAAVRDARTALFLGDGAAEPLLARIAAGDTGPVADEPEGLQGIVDWQGYEVAVYGRRGSLRLLPLLDAP